MAMKNGGRSQAATSDSQAFVEVEGFKSIATAQRVYLGKVAVLAGANSSGKSSLMQPLLLLKQTLECSYDPGVIKLDGPNVVFDAGSDIFRTDSRPANRRFRVRAQTSSGLWSEVEYKLVESGGFEIVRMSGRCPPLLRQKREKSVDFELHRNTSVDRVRDLYYRLIPARVPLEYRQKRFFLCPERCFWGITPGAEGSEQRRLGPGASLAAILGFALRRLALRTLHLPGLRGNPLREYPVSGVASGYPGVFSTYTATVINEWRREMKTEQLLAITNALQRLGLTHAIKTERIGDTRVRLLVARLPRPCGELDVDYVSIADVGVGVSQVLPLLVALAAAESGSFIFVEQPEIHLHPRAQTVLCELMLEAAERGVNVIVETHSSLIVQGFQTLVAQGRLSQDDLKLHWCTRDPKTGETTVRLAELDDTGAFGDWPEDFSDTQLAAEGAYLDAAMKRKLARAKK